MSKNLTIKLSILYVTLRLQITRAKKSLSLVLETVKLRCYTRFQRALLRVFAFSKYLPWFEPTNVISLKTQLHANACVKCSSQRSFTNSQLKEGKISIL